MAEWARLKPALLMYGLRARRVLGRISLERGDHRAAVASFLASADGATDRERAWSDAWRGLTLELAGEPERAQVCHERAAPRLSKRSQAETLLRALGAGNSERPDWIEHARALAARTRDPVMDDVVAALQTEDLPEAQARARLAAIEGEGSALSSWTRLATRLVRHRRGFDTD